VKLVTWESKTARRSTSKDGGWKAGQEVIVFSHYFVSYVIRELLGITTHGN